METTEENEKLFNIPVPVKETLHKMKTCQKIPLKRTQSLPIGTHTSNYNGISKLGNHPIPTARRTSYINCPKKYMFRSLSSHSQKAVPTMDTIVPSPGFMNAQFATSPHSLSIYDQERSDMLNSLCAGVAVPGNFTADQSLSEEGCSLDDKYEDSTLQNFLTSEVMNTLQRTPQAALPSDFYCEGKVSADNSSTIGVGAIDSNDPTLAQLNMDTDFSFVEEILNCDSNSTLDLLCPDVKRQTPNFLTQSTTTSTASSEASRNFSGMFTVSSQITNDVQKLSREVPNGTVQNSSQRNVESAFLRNIVPMKANFPPRDTQPQIIGVVTPVIKFESPVTVHDEFKSDSKLGKLQNSSPYLHKLLCKQPQSVVKSEAGGSAPGNNTVTVAMVTNELPPQTVPSPTATKRTYIKLEPASGDIGPDREESMEEKWKDIKKFMHTPEEEPPVKKRKRCDSGGSGHTSDDEIDEDDDDGDSMYGGKDGDDSDDDYSDIDADLAQMSPSECESLVGMGKKQKQYFWQYNVQAKGPKGTRLKLAVEAPSDPHILNGFEDPVFDECNTAVAGIRHGGKARKGDGNEVTPNPKKLFMIGHQLMRLNRQINACQLGADVPSAKRNESRKEKNKLASRACRLKKKAQHEANKIKLYGLEKEHSHLNSVLKMIWPLIKEKAKTLLGQGDKLSPPTSAPSSRPPLASVLEGYIGEHLKEMIAENTTDYVNSVILKVESGENNGGLQIKGRKT